MKTLLFYPQEKIKNNFKNNKNIIFFDNFGFYFYKNKKKLRIKDQDGFSLLKKISLLKKKNIKYFIKLIRNWGPIFSRDFDQLQYHELNLRLLLGRLLFILYMLEKLQVKSCIMFTALPHHIKSLIFDLALRELNVKTVYLQNSRGLIYNNEDQAVPILSTSKFMQKDILNLKISDFKFNDSIDKYIGIINKKYNKNSSIFFKYPHVLEKFYSKNFFLSCLISFFYYLYDYIKNRSFRKVDTFITNNNYKISTHIHMLNQQRKAINFYNKNKTKFRDIRKKKYILIAANYQPEASSYPMAEDDYNHIDFISELSLRIKKYSILYKEHYDSFYYYLDLIRNTKVGVFRSEDYYKQIKKIGCKILCEETNINNKWFLNNTIPVTIGGSISIERSLLGYKSVSMGSPWYKGMPGVLTMDEFLKSINKRNLFKKDKEIAKKSRLFLINKLNNKCFANDFNLGAVQSNLKESSKSRVESINKIIDYLNKI